MAKTITAIFENGIFKPLEKVKLSNHKKIQLMVFPMDEEIPELVKSQKRALKKYCGIGKSGLTDVSRNHDKYLYGK
ncbi:MAG: antitoxin family protein [Candidatus Goldbacteria bacterium]|nr:antitoxin family protein [Candidatus Goldiibacteriota bacterium]